MYVSLSLLTFVRCNDTTRRAAMIDWHPERNTLQPSLLISRVAQHGQLQRLYSYYWMGCFQARMQRYIVVY